MKQIIAMHGWCSDRTFWKDWKKYFQSKGWLWQDGERGYGYIEQSEPFWEKTPNYSLIQQKVIFYI